MAKNDFIYITKKMIENVKNGCHDDSFDSVFAGFEKFCGNDHVHIDGADNYVPDEEMISIYSTTNWDEKELETFVRRSTNVYNEPCQPTIINPTRYIQLLSDSDLYAFMELLVKLKNHGGIVLDDANVVNNINEYKEKIGKTTNKHIGFIYLTNSFKQCFKSVNAYVLNWIIHDYEYHMNNVYIGNGDYINLKHNGDSFDLLEYYKTEDLIKLNNHDNSGDLANTLLMAWDVTDYYLRDTKVNVCYKSLAVQEFIDLGGAIFYKGTPYTDFEKLLETINNKYKLTNKKHKQK